MGKKNSKNVKNLKKSNTSKKLKIEEEKTNKKKIIFPILIMIIGFVIGVYFYSNRTEQALVLKEYFRCLSDKNYEAMYDLVLTDMPKEDFVARVKNIYEGIEAKDIKVIVAANTTNKNVNSSKEGKADASDENKQSQNDINENDVNMVSNEDITENITTVTYTNSMETLAGDISFVNSAEIVNIDGVHKIKWDSSMIFPDLKDNQKIRVSNLQYTRGTIYDKNGIAIAKEGNVYEVGIVPGRMNETTNLEQVALLTGVSRETINNSLGAEYVKEDTFVPIKRISREEQELKNNLLKIKGIMVTDVKARVYPYKNATSILTGYVQEGEGKTGLEYAYNDKLKGTNGAEIYIEGESGNKVKILAKRDVKNGQDVKLTIDVNLQNKIYENFKEDEGAQVAIDYNTGAVLALVSTPSYDANKFSLGITDEEWGALQNDVKKPMYNKYLSTYAPGSSLKPIIGAIGLANGSFVADEDFGRSGTKWQEDSSWKDLYVTTLETYNEPANLENALVYSDNIYFAKAALKIGKSNLQNSLNNLGFNTKIKFVQDAAVSTYGNMESSAAIANSGYGQSEMLVNPIHLAMMYSCFANGGNMVMPYIEIKDEKDNSEENNYYKQNTITKEIADTIKNSLIQVVERGTAKECKIEGKVIAGKTGTAEIKEHQEDKNGTEIGWFNAFDEDGLLIVSMVQNVKSLGGSHYVVKKVKTVFE